MCVREVWYSYVCMRACAYVYVCASLPTCVIVCVYACVCAHACVIANLTIMLIFVCARILCLRTCTHERVLQCVRTFVHKLARAGIRF